MASSIRHPRDCNAGRIGIPRNARGTGPKLRFSGFPIFTALGCAVSQCMRKVFSFPVHCKGPYTVSFNQPQRGKGNTFYSIRMRAA